MLWSCVCIHEFADRAIEGKCRWIHLQVCATKTWRWTVISIMDDLWPGPSWCARTPSPGPACLHVTSRGHVPAPCRPAPPQGFSPTSENRRSWKSSLFCFWIVKFLFLKLYTFFVCYFYASNDWATANLANLARNAIWNEVLFFSGHKDNLPTWNFDRKHTKNSIW